MVFGEGVVEFWVEVLESIIVIRIFEGVRKENLILFRNL